MSRRFGQKADKWPLQRGRQRRNHLGQGDHRLREFRLWYETLVDDCDWSGPRDYQRWLAILSTPEAVTGYREVRYPKMQAARQRAERCLATAPDLFEPSSAEPPMPATAVRRAKGTVSLPVMPTHVGA